MLNVNGLWHGLPQRLGRMFDKDRQNDPAWKPVHNGGKVQLDLTADPNAGDDTVVGFFTVADWSKDPVQVRRFPGPGHYTIEGLQPGEYVIGAVAGGLPQTGFGVHRRWPAFIHVRAGQTTPVQVHVSSTAMDDPWLGSDAEDRLRGWAGKFGKLDPGSTVKIRLVDPQGKAVPFGVAGVSVNNKPYFLSLGTNADGYACTDKITGPFAVATTRYQSDPWTLQDMSYRQQYSRMYPARDLTVTVDEIPSGTGKLTGTVRGKDGRPITEYILAVKRTATPVRGTNMGNTSFICRKVVIDPHGRYEMTGLPPGRYEAFCVLPLTGAYTRLFGNGPRFEIGPERGATALLDFDLEPMQLWYGRAIYEDGSPVFPGEYSAWAVPPQRRQRGQISGGMIMPTKPDGSFCVSLSPREYRDLIAENDGLIDILETTPGHIAKLGDVPIDKLSRDKARPTVVVLPREPISSNQRRPAKIVATQPSRQVPERS